MRALLHGELLMQPPLDAFHQTHLHCLACFTLLSGAGEPNAGCINARLALFIPPTHLPHPWPVPPFLQVVVVTLQPLIWSHFIPQTLTRPFPGTSGTGGPNTG